LVALAGDAQQVEGFLLGHHSGSHQYAYRGADLAVAVECFAKMVVVTAEGGAG
jgi:hypothetical protein